MNSRSTPRGSPPFREPHIDEPGATGPASGPDRRDDAAGRMPPPLRRHPDADAVVPPPLRPGRHLAPDGGAGMGPGGMARPGAGQPAGDDPHAARGLRGRPAAEQELATELAFVRGDLARARNEAEQLKAELEQARGQEQGADGTAGHESPAALQAELDALRAAQAELQTRFEQQQAEAEALRADVAQARDAQVRAAAEMENVRRRAQEDVAKARKFGIESFAESLVPVADSLEMALKVDTPTVQNLREGVEATLRQLQGAFERNHLGEIDPAGEKFDPNFHQAISVAPAHGVPPNHVVSVLQKGYRIADRVLRPALVTVSPGG